MSDKMTLWKANVRGVIERMANESYQRAALFNQHREVSSPDELINQLMGDYLFAEFIENKAVGLTGAEQAAARIFYLYLNEFCQNTPNYLDPAQMIDDPRWNTVRQEAQKLLQKFLF